MIEIWKSVKEYEGLYQVSSKGRVKSLERETRHGHHKKERILSLGLSACGYHCVVLCKNGKQKTYSVHRLVAVAFIKNPDNKEEVNHKNGVRAYNWVCNLEWATRSENQLHAIHELKRNSARGERHGRTRLTRVDVLQIRESRLSQRKLAKIFYISQASIWAIKNDKTWNDLKV